MLIIIALVGDAELSEVQRIRHRQPAVKRGMNGMEEQVSIAELRALSRVDRRSGTRSPGPVTLAGLSLSGR